MNITVARKLKSMRKQHGWSQEKVADDLNISQPTYARIEKGESNSWVTYIKPICSLYDIEPEDLLKEDNIIISQNQKEGNSAFVINKLSEKLIEQYEFRIREKDNYINKLEKLLNK